MGMYTELIFGAELKLETPPEVIAMLQLLVEGVPRGIEPELLPEHPFFKCTRWDCLFTMGSSYFGVKAPVNKMWQDEYNHKWIVSTRSNLKDYDGEIKKFLDWIYPYVESGSGECEVYAMVTYEENEFPSIYMLREPGYDNKAHTWAYYGKPSDEKTILMVAEKA
jgi:hypothetical protein